MSTDGRHNKESLPRLATVEQLPRRLTHALFTAQPPEPTPTSELAQAWRDGYSAGHVDAIDHDVEPANNPYGPL